MTPMLRSGETSHIVSPPRQSLPWRIAKLHRINAHEHGAESREVEANQPNARDGEVRPGQCRAHTQQRSHGARRATDRGVRSAALHCSTHPPAAAAARASALARAQGLAPVPVPDVIRITHAGSSSTYSAMVFSLVSARRPDACGRNTR